MFATSDADLRRYGKSDTSWGNDVTEIIKVGEKECNPGNYSAPT
jgi:hypothetical protein